jgi:hypothetical protein
MSSTILNLGGYVRSAARRPARRRDPFWSCHWTQDNGCRSGSARPRINHLKVKANLDAIVTAASNPAGIQTKQAVALMACESQEMIARMLEADHSFIKTCWCIYVATLVTGVILTLYLGLSPIAHAPTPMGMLATGIAFPFIPKHLQRLGAVHILNALSQDCYGHDKDDPACKRIADNVDAILRSRGRYKWAHHRYLLMIPASVPPV